MDSSHPLLDGHAVLIGSHDVVLPSKPISGGRVVTASTAVVADDVILSLRRRGSKTDFGVLRCR